MLPLLFVKVEEEEGGPRIVAPGVGMWSEPPPAGTLLGPGSGVGFLRRLNSTHRLVMPDGVAGRVVETHRERLTPVAFGQTLFRLAPFGADQALTSVAGPGGGRSAAAGDLPEGAAAVVAPTDGVFYRRASPDSPAFVEVGSVVRHGQTVGLVEVMKTFNQILYGGPDRPQEACVVEIRAEDASEVKAGQVLVVTMPTDR